MIALANVIALLLMAIALLHLHWALGGKWPGTDETSLSHTVFGQNGVDAMPDQSLTAVVSGLIALAALWPLVWVGPLALPLPDWFVGLGMVVLTLVFLGRGVAGYLPAVTNRHAQQPFARLNARLYSPLITAIGVGLFTLLVAGPGEAWHS
ncbi:MAG: DUF3995 domain-containing protein [Pseudomonadota bacterium]